MIDTHAHLDFGNYDNDREDVIARFFDDNGKAIINVGCSERHIENSQRLASFYENIYFTVGIHPEEEDVDPEEVGGKIERFVKEKKAVAIGEIGLDYFHNDKNKKWQKGLFVSQLNVARKSGLPVIIHCRNAYDDVHEIISTEEYGSVKMVIHCYEGGVKETEKFLNLPNVWFSFTGNITFAKSESAEIFEIIRSIPLERIMVETDCPFLAPVPNRGKRNEPSFVRHVIDALAEARGLSAERVEEQTDQNAIGFFNLPK